MTIDSVSSISRKEEREKKIRPSFIQIMLITLVYYNSKEISSSDWRLNQNIDF